MIENRLLLRHSPPTTAKTDKGQIPAGQRRKAKRLTEAEMKKMLSLALIGALSIPVLSAPADAGPLSRACMGSDRKAKSRRMCNCIQQVANKNLNRSQQRLAASFFDDPHKAQVIRQSDNPIHEKFWKRYKLFGAKVAKSCKSYR